MTIGEVRELEEKIRAAYILKTVPLELHNEIKQRFVKNGSPIIEELKYFLSHSCIKMAMRKDNNLNGSRMYYGLRYKDMGIEII